MNRATAAAALTLALAGCGVYEIKSYTKARANGLAEGVNKVRKYLYDRGLEEIRHGDSRATGSGADGLAEEGGKDGTMGTEGSTGAAGPAGDVGATGDMGTPGHDGIAGADGAAGKDGSGCSVASKEISCRNKGSKHYITTQVKVTCTDGSSAILSEEEGKKKSGSCPN